jgi:hypothetical protein
MDTRLRMPFMPFRGGLATAGKRSTIDEGHLWGAQNVYPDLDGMPRSRPGTVQHGQRLMYPDAETATSYSYYEPFANISNWSITSEPTYSLNNGMLTIIISDTTTFWEHADSTTPTGANVTIRFTARLVGVEDTVGAENGGQLRVHWSANGVQRQVVITARGVGLANGTLYDHVLATDSLMLDLDGFHTYEFRYTGSSDTVDVYIDDVFVVTIDTFSGDVGDTTTSLAFELTAGLATPTQWSLFLTDVMYTDTIADGALVAQPIIDVGQYEQLLVGGTTRKHLLCATDQYLYVDTYERGAWKPVMRVEPGHTRMLPFQDRLIIFDDTGSTNARMYAWSGMEPPTQIDGTPPARFGVEHRTRLFVAGDRNVPLRVYFSASRSYTTWFAPDYYSESTFDAVTRAGYIDVPSETGDEITGIYGEFYGSMIIVTKRGIWRLMGSSPQSFQMDNITKQVGGESPDGIVQIGNDLYIVGRQGVVNLQAAQASGDLQTGMPSGAIANKWSSLPDIANRIDKRQLKDAYFSSLPSLNLSVLGMREQGDTTLSGMYVLSAATSAWYGPWTIEPTCFKQVEVGIPAVETLLLGTEAGYALLLRLGIYTDRDESYTTKLEFPMYSGRSLSPDITHRQKTWRMIRLFILPTIAEEITVGWRTDTELYDTVEILPVPDDAPSLSDDFRLDIDRLSSPEELSVLEIPLDSRGMHLHFYIESEYPLYFQGLELEFLASGFAIPEAS